MFIKMTITDALDFLGISSASSRTELESAFRRLVKTYHPDKNLDRSAWSHTMTVRLNEAYDIVLKHVTKNPRIIVIPPEERKKEASPRTDQTTIEYFRRSFRTAQNEALQGIYLYYNFGLENIHRRSESVFRQRFNAALHHLKRSIDSLTVLAPKAPNEGLRKHIALYSTFFKLFRENMLINKILVPDGSLNHKAYRHYRSGSENLDEVIKYRLFPKDFNKNGFSSKTLALSDYEFMIIITQFKTTMWVTETVIKLMLMDSFRRIEEFERA